MNPGSTAPSQHRLWQISHQHAGVWRCWQGEVVIYDDLSGDTMKLDIIMSAVFRFMLHGPVTESQIAHHLASRWELKADPQIGNLAALALRRLREAEMIRPA